MSDKMAPSRFCWNELVTTDPAGAQDFYGQLFGWESEDMDMGDMVYHFMKKPGDEDPAAGMMKVPMEGLPSHWMSYVLVEDTAATVAKAQELGAEIIKETTELPMGILAIFKDPQGACFAVWQPKGDPPEGCEDDG